MSLFVVKYGNSNKFTDGCDNGHAMSDAIDKRPRL